MTDYRIEEAGQSLADTAAAFLKTGVSPYEKNGTKTVVVGGGAAGMIAASYAAIFGSDVILLEKMNRLGKKLRITGKGRCNVTNCCEPEEFLKNIPGNPKFMFSSLYDFPPSAVMALFEALSVPLKVERGRRVFPVSDQAGDIVAAMEKLCAKSGVRIQKSAATGLLTEALPEVPEEDAADVTSNSKKAKKKSGKKIKATHRITGVQTEDGVIFADRVIICTGGKSYPGTGSTGDGYDFAESVGIAVTELLPSLVPLVTMEDVSELAGLSLKNVTLTILDSKGNAVFSEMGEMLFTHFGLSGPLVLSASAHMRRIGEEFYMASIDLKPALDEETLDKRLLSDFEKYKNKDFINALGDLLPIKLIKPVAAASGIDERCKVNAITREMRHALLTALKGMRYKIEGFRPIEEAIVTHGGIHVSEISPSTMESKRVEGLYFAGEVLDVDAYTGGYNLQIAFSTGVCAGKNAAIKAKE